MSGRIHIVSDASTYDAALEQLPTNLRERKTQLAVDLAKAEAAA